MITSKPKIGDKLWCVWGGQFHKRPSAYVTVTAVSRRYGTFVTDCGIYYEFTLATGRQGRDSDRRGVTFQLWPSHADQEESEAIEARFKKLQGAAAQMEKYK